MQLLEDTGIFPGTSQIVQIVPAFFPGPALEAPPHFAVAVETHLLQRASESVSSPLHQIPLMHIVLVVKKCPEKETTNIP